MSTGPHTPDGVPPGHSPVQPPTDDDQRTAEWVRHLEQVAARRSDGSWRGELERLAGDLRGCLLMSQPLEAATKQRGMGIDGRVVDRNVREFWQRARILTMNTPAGVNAPRVPDEPGELWTGADERNALAVLVRWAEECVRAADARPPGTSPPTRAEQGEGEKPPRVPPNPPLLDQAKQFLAVKARVEEARKIAQELLPYILFPPNGLFGGATGSPAATPPGGGDAPTPATGTGGSKGATPGNTRAMRIPLAEAEILVRDWLMKHGKDNPDGITRDAVAAGTGASAGTVSKTAAWKAFRERRDAGTKPGAREVPLTDRMQAVVPDNCESPDELAALIEEQKADEAEEYRRHKRRHKPS